MRNTLCEGCGQHSFLIPLHGGKGGPLHPGTLKYEPHAADVTGLRRALEAVIERG